MELKTYTYTLSQFPNNKVYLPTLETEVRNSDIIISLDYINLIGNDCMFIFKSGLTSNDKTILDNIVQNHIGNVVEQELPTKVKVVEESPDGVYKTQGYYQATSIYIDIPATNGTYHKDISFPYYIAIASAQWFNSDENLGDDASFVLSPDTLIGTITSDINSGETVINVSDSVLSNAKLGFYVKIGNDELGKIINIDNINKTITTEYPLTNNYLSVDNIFVYITIKIVDEYIFNGNGLIEMGSAKIGTSLIPPNTIMRIIYNNKNGKSKKFSILIDYNY